jgi:cell fate regulator YaaT (PSP1 superfamily)
MACSSCSPQGCGNKGHCATGSCNKMNTYDWITTLDLRDPTEFEMVEVSFKNGARKEFYINDAKAQASTGDLVLVEAQSGYNIGKISLSGELVRLQMKKKNWAQDKVIHRVIRKANERDLEKLEQARNMEHENMVKARVIARTLGLKMKIGDVEYQADLRKVTFYYTADDRVDFRELVKEYAREFRVKIEMRQIGARQESARIGGIGSCGRELCCSTWLSDFKSVNTAAARYQNISINQTKLSGQCGRLKCCLNYELDTYLDALKSFPPNPDYIMTAKGKAVLVKTDIFKGLLYYSYISAELGGAFIPIDKEKVKEILTLNKKGVFPEDLVSLTKVTPVSEAGEDDDQNQDYIKFADVTGEIELPAEKRKPRRKKKPQQRNTDSNRGSRSSDAIRNPQGRINKESDDSTAKPNQGENSSSRDNANQHVGNQGAKGNTGNRRAHQNKPHRQDKADGQKTNQSKAHTAKQNHERNNPPPSIVNDKDQNTGEKNTGEENTQTNTSNNPGRKGRKGRYRGGNRRGPNKPPAE